MTKFRTPYTKRVRVSLDFLDEDGKQAIGRTEQHHKPACDINNIIRQYDKTGLITHTNAVKATYGDFTEVNEYQVALNSVIEAQASFSELPSDIRKKFGNDPGAFIEFVTNPDNAEECVKMGLADAPTPEVIPKVEVVNPPQEQLPA
jgi:phage internal scaffolding protein